MLSFLKPQKNINKITISTNSVSTDRIVQTHLLVDLLFAISVNSFVVENNYAMLVEVIGLFLQIIPVQHIQKYILAALSRFTHELII